jgi:NAD(P)-dependent dehydrogenase (short-subunit alcohol dehydrogenase family)
MKTQKTWIITGASRGFGNDIIKAVLAAGDKVWQRYALNGKLFQLFNAHENLLVVAGD